jgi:hypothetical protein
LIKVNFLKDKAQKDLVYGEELDKIDKLYDEKVLKLFNKNQ